MRISRLETGLSVSAQVLPAELTAVAALGFRAILCNRPDGEGADQPSHQQLAQAANLLGLAFAYVPVTSGKISDDDVLAFDQALSSLPAPVQAYCRTGTRSATLWGLLRVRTLPARAVLDRAAAAGFNLPALQSRIDGTRPSRLAWLLKERMLPPIHWHGMLKGREWLARPQSLKLNGQ